MMRLSILLTGAVLGAAALGSAFGTPPALPPGHPTTAPTLPPGHPPLTPPPAAAPDAPAPADPADVASIEAIVDAYYESISGPAGQARNWERFRALLLPDARLITTRTVADQTAMITLTAEQYIEANRTYFERGGYFESELHREADAYGNIAQVFSTYASRRRVDDAEPYSRGINSLQLIRFDGRWWIVSVMWDYERADGNALPARYLPE